LFALKPNGKHSQLVITGPEYGSNTLQFLWVLTFAENRNLYAVVIKLALRSCLSGTFLVYILVTPSHLPLPPPSFIYYSKWSDSGEIRPPGPTRFQVDFSAIRFLGMRKSCGCTSGVGFARGSQGWWNGHKFHLIIIYSLESSDKVGTDLMHKCDTYSHWRVTIT
jgi:hypothetical protein